MIRSSFLVIITVVVVAVFCDDIIKIKQGTLRGRRLFTRKGREIFSFQGIPYAKPPIDDLRFQPPQPPEPWSGVLDATKEGPICVQRGLFPTDQEMKGQEDCLYLNVYTPQIPKSGEEQTPLDVMFWIHGGGLYAGSGNTDMYGPEYLLDKDVILVTINYRLGILGFFSTGDTICPGNNGMKDQVAALRWVKNNIAAFGGNPSSVTIFGESAGGASVHFHMMSPMSKGLFHRAISQSGVATLAFAISSLQTTYHIIGRVSSLFGCPAHPSTELISCLKQKTAYDLFASDHAIKKEGISPVSFQPVIETSVTDGDEVFINQEPLQALLSEDLNLVPWMVGITSSEGGFLSQMLVKPGSSSINVEENPLLSFLFDFTDENLSVEDVNQKIQDFYFGGQPITNESVSGLVNLGSDAFFLTPANTAVKLHSRRKATVYYYYFDYRGTNSFSTIFADPNIDYGVVHIDDLLYLFPQDYCFPDSKKTPEDEYMIDFMTTLWANFAKRGNPTPMWYSVSSPEVLEYAHINSKGLNLGKRLLKNRVDFWDSLPITVKYTSTSKDEL